MALAHGAANQADGVATRLSRSPSVVSLNASSGFFTSSNITSINGSTLTLGQTTSAASLPVTIASNQSAIPISGSIEVIGSSFSHISTNTTTAVKSGSGVLHKIVINTKGATANIATVYDNTAGSGTVIAVIDTTSAIASLIYDLAFATGLTIVTATGTAADLTIVYK